jgi:hypothetical protein
MKHRIAVIAWIGLALAATGCDAGFKPNTPEGFVAFEDVTAKSWWQQSNAHAGYDYRAISPDGVVLAVRRVENDPKANLAYWSQAVQERLRANGSYRVDSERDVTNHQGIAGHELTLKLGEGGAEQTYRVALFEHGQWLYLLESGGPTTKVTQHSVSLDEAIRGISFN